MGVSQALKLLKSFCLPAYSNILFPFPNRYHHTGLAHIGTQVCLTGGVGGPLHVVSSIKSMHEITQAVHRLTQYKPRPNSSIPPDNFSPSFSEEQVDPVTSLQVWLQVQQSTFQTTPDDVVCLVLSYSPGGHISVASTDSRYDRSLSSLCIWVCECCVKEIQKMRSSPSASH